MPSEVLLPVNCWADTENYNKTLTHLASLFTKVRLQGWWWWSKERTQQRRSFDALCLLPDNLQCNCALASCKIASFHPVGASCDAVSPPFNSACRTLSSSRMVAAT